MSAKTAIESPSLATVSEFGTFQNPRAGGAVIMAVDSGWTHDGTQT